MNWPPKHGIVVFGKSLNRLFLYVVLQCQAHCPSKFLFNVFWMAIFPRLAIRCSTSQSFKGAITVSKFFFFKNLVF